MVFCIVGIVIFGILGIFSAKYRRYFRESLHCLKRQMLLKPCDTKFDMKMKAKIAAAAGKFWPALGRFVFRRFMLLSWVMILMLIFSVASVGIGVYNTVAYGNCNGPDSTDFCLFNPGMTGGSGHSMHDGIRTGAIEPVSLDDDPSLGSPDAPVKIVEVGCFRCPYTKKAESLRQQILEKYGGNVSFTFRTLPLPSHKLSWETAEAANCALEQGKYWVYHDKLFEYQKEMSMEKIKEIAGEIGLDQNQFNECFDAGKYKDEVKKDHDDAVAAGIYATPTFFINGKPFVGPKTFAEFEQLVQSELHASCPEEL